MRLCPACSSAFHTSCLYVHTKKKNAGSADWDALPTANESPMSARTLVQTPSVSPTRKQPKASELQALARLPLLKGGPHGVTGNVETVRAAQALVDSEKRPVTAKWQEDLGGKDYVQDLLDFAEEEAQRAYDCPKCGKPI